MSEILDVNAAELLDMVSNEQRVVVLIWIRSCSQCSKFKPVFNQLPAHFDDVTFLRMNQLKTIENLRLSEAHGMDETPTMFVYCKGEFVEAIVGYHSLEDSVKLITDVFNRDCY